MRRMITCLLAAAFSISSATAQNVGVTARASVGLDPDTREFIEGLPSKWQPQLNAIFNDLMGRTDKSFSTYVEKVDQLIVKAMNETKCDVAATQKKIVDDIVQRFPWVRQAGSVQRAAEEVEKGNKQRRLDSSPTSIKYLYDAHTQLVSVVSCEPGQRNNAKKDLEKILNDYDAKWLVWNRLENTKCANVKECMTVYRKTIEAEVRTSDSYKARDVKASKADDALKDVAEPEMPKFPYWTVNFDDFESTLTKLYRIENSIYAARAVRAAQADEKWASAEKQYAKAIKSLSNETYVMSGSPGDPTDGDWANARSRTPVIKKDLDAALASAKEASETDSKYTTPHNEMKTTSLKHFDEWNALRRKVFRCGTAIADKAHCS